MSVILGWPAVDQVLLICALLGGVAFLVWLVLQFVGGGLDGDLDAGGGLDAGEVSGQADASFTLLSFQGISAFLTIFGLVGLSVHREMGAPAGAALGGGVAAGLLMSWVLDRLFAFFRGLQSSGNLNMDNAIGQEGTVYLRIPSAGVGKLQVSFQNRLKVLNAVTDSPVDLETGTRVRVTRVVNGDTLSVEPLASDGS